ncbi:MAG: hypothetical protein WAV18_24345 [Roseiarcus sp.]
MAFNAIFASRAVAIFTMTPPRGKPPAMKALALLLYAMGNVSFGAHRYFVWVGCTTGGFRGLADWRIT